MQISQIIAEAEKSNSSLTKALLKKIKDLIKENNLLESDFNEEAFVKSNSLLQNQLAKVTSEIKNEDNSFKKMVADKAMRNVELSKLCGEEQKLLALTKNQQETNSRYVEAIERINVQIANLNEEKARRDKIINEFYDNKNHYEALQKECEEKNNELKIYGPEAEKKLKKVSELEPKIKALKKAIDDVEPAIKEIWGLLDNDNFDAFVGHK